MMMQSFTQYQRAKTWAFCKRHAEYVGVLMLWFTMHLWSPQVVTWRIMFGGWIFYTGVRLMRWSQRDDDAVDAESERSH